MKVQLASLAMFVVMAVSACGADVAETTLQLPHAPRPGEIISLKVTLGTLARGHRVEISTDAGRLLAAISPFGKRDDRKSEIYTVPVPPDAVSADHISLRLVINDGKQKRLPRSEEIRDIAVNVSSADAP